MVKEVYSSSNLNIQTLIVFHPWNFWVTKQKKIIRIYPFRKNDFFFAFNKTHIGIHQLNLKRKKVWNCEGGIFYERINFYHQRPKNYSRALKRSLRILSSIKTSRKLARSQNNFQSCFFGSFDKFTFFLLSFWWIFLKKNTQNCQTEKLIGIFRYWKLSDGFSL